jgi:protein-glutamine gamma-glutamyltransferase
VIEQEVAWKPRTDERIGKFIAGRVLPHVCIVGYLLYFVMRAVSTIHQALWIFVPLYFLFTMAHTAVAVRRIRFLVHIGATTALTVLLIAGARVLAPNSESGSYVATTLAAFTALLLWFSAVNNYWFLLSRWYYLVELALVNVIWITLIVSRLESSITAILGMSFPILAYSLYILFADYTLGRRIDKAGRRKLFRRYGVVLLVLLLGALIGYIAGLGKGSASHARSYSLLSSKNDRFIVQDRAKLEEELKIPLDSKELVFVAHIDPVNVDGVPYSIGYYLKFHSLFNYDPDKMEFSGAADEMEDPRFRVRAVPLDQTQLNPTHLTVDLDGRDIVPPYALRADGKSTLYNVKLSTEQNFGHNLTYRFVSYPTKDSIAVADQTYPLLGIHTLYSKISILNFIPIGTAGTLFQFDFNRLVLERIRNYPDVDQVPLRFSQQYLNIAGLEQDIADTARFLTRDCRSTTEKISSIIRFFTRKNSDGRPVYVYDLKPGKSPDPSESLLHYFLFKSHRGYCTYYATAAALFFRAAGIPSRVAVGFVPGESSRQNPDWYFVYSQQAHAWTELYLGPSLGWVDLDLTPAGQNSDAPPPPMPTPPTPPVPLDSRYTLTGVVTRTGDALSCRVAAILRKEEAEDIAICPAARDRDIRLVFDSTEDATVGVSPARRAATDIIRDLKIGDSIRVAGKEHTNPGLRDCSFDRFVFHQIVALPRVSKDSLQRSSRAATGARWWSNPWLYIGMGLYLLLIILLLPWLYLRLLSLKIRGTSSETTRLSSTRRWILLVLHMQRAGTITETDAEYARRLRVSHGLDVEEFFNAYLRCRYFNAEAESQKALCLATMRRTRAAVSRLAPWYRRILRMVNTWEYIRFINRGKTA